MQLAFTHLCGGGVASEAASQASPKGFSVADFFKPFQLPISKVSSSDVIKALGKFLPVRYQKGITSNAISGCRYHIGDYAEGGVIIWLTNDGMHGLVVAIEDAKEGADTTFKWGENAATTNVRTRKSLPFSTPRSPYGEYYGGYINQQAIEDMSNLQTKYPAFAAAANYSITVNGVTYDDWWLPSTTELLLVYVAKDVIKEVSEHNGGAGLQPDLGFYWSSEEYQIETFQAFTVSMGIGTQVTCQKRDKYPVRPVRAF